MTLTLGERCRTRSRPRNAGKPSSPTATCRKLGLTLAPANKVAGADRQGVVVTAVDPNGVAADHGFQAGDVILDVGGKSVSNPSDVRKRSRTPARKVSAHSCSA